MTTQPPSRNRFGSADLVVLLVLAAAIYGVNEGANDWTATYQPVSQISLDPSLLPRYTMLSLLRGFAAYGLSLAFTLIYGRLAAYHRRAERVMVPMLDIFQSIPVLGFLPGLVLALVTLFPRSNVGLELACILMIFTGQVWNLTFSFYHSLKSIPDDLREAANVYRMSGWQKFTTVELPSAAIGLVWNSMMSMAGGWFFLTVTEAFVLGKNDFRLPGVGSYMSVAIAQGDVRAMVLGVVAMIVMIVTVDWMVWRPLVAWSYKFKLEETESGEPPRSTFLQILRRSRVFRLVRRFLRNDATRVIARAAALRPVDATVKGIGRGSAVIEAVIWVVASVCTVFGVVKLIALLCELSGRDWFRVVELDVFTLLRVMAAVALGTLWAVPAGVAIGLNPRLAQRLQPVTQVLASFPAPMVFPLVIIVLHMLGVTLQFGSVVLMMLGTQWYLLFNVIAGAMAIPQDLREAASVYRLVRVERWKRLILPAIFPSLVTGWVTATGGAWNASIVAECVQFRSETLRAAGLGAEITRATDEGNFAVLAAAVLAMCVTVMLINRAVWQPLYRLAEERFSLNK